MSIFAPPNFDFCQSGNADPPQLEGSIDLTYYVGEDDNLGEVAKDDVVTDFGRSYGSW